MAFECVLQAWHSHQAELHGFLIGQMKEPAMADDVLQARDLGPMSQNVYAQAQGISPPAAKARIRRARERLREALARRCDVVLDGSGNVCCYSQSDGCKCGAYCPDV